MGTYKNDYVKEQDECLWEIHEIRHELHKELEQKSISEINSEAKKIFERWEKEILVKK